MLERKKLSVIIPVYNTEKYIDKCLFSVCNQTYKNLEIIIVNDGTLDNSEEIINKYLNLDSRIVYLKKENGGLSSARNFGLLHATGDFFAFVDSDDFIELDMYESMMKYSNNADIIISGHYIFDGKTETISGIKNYSPLTLNSQEALIELCKNKYIESHVWDKLYKKDLFDNICFPLNKNYEDIYIMHKLFEKAKSIVHINNPKYYYVKRSNSISHVDSLKNITDLFDALFQRYEYLKKYCNKEMNLIQEAVIADYYLYYGQFYKKSLKKIWKFLVELSDGFDKYLSRKRRIQLKLLKFKVSLKVQYKFFSLVKNNRRFINLFASKKVSFNINKTHDTQVFFIGYPEYNNLGDHAIAYASIKYLEDHFSSKKINIITESNFKRNYSKIKKNIKKTDLIFVQGGGNVGDEYKDQELMRKKIIKAFPHNLIINFPVTIYFKKENNYKKIMYKYYNKDYYFLCREKYTYQYIANDKNIKSYLTPDIVLYLKGKTDLFKDKAIDEKKVICCLRNDVESKLSFDDRLDIKRFLFNKGYNIDSLDTCTKYDIPQTNSENEIKKCLNKFCEAKFVVTDRLHGLIFAYLSGVPCIVFNNYNYKIKGIYEWLKNTGMVYLAKDLNEFNYILDNNNLNEKKIVEFNNSFDVIYKILEEHKWK